MGEALLGRAFTLSDSVFFFLLVVLGIAFWRLIIYVLRKNDDRETRYIAVIEIQAKGLQNVEELRADVKEIKHFIFTQKGGGTDARRH